MKDLLAKISENNIVLEVLDGELKVFAHDRQRVDAHVIEQIRQNKNELIRFLSGSAVGSGAQQIMLASSLFYGGYRMSSSQRRLWIINQFQEADIAYNIPAAYTLEGELDVKAFERAFSSLVERHEILRTVFREDASSEVCQFVLSESESGFSVGYDDIRSLSEDVREDFVRKSVQREIEHVFDLSSGPLLRARLFQLSAERWVFSYVMHHIISDGWSMGILFRELLSLYKGYSQGVVVELKPLRIQYKDYAASQQEQLSGESLKIHRQYWLDQFNGELPVLNLPMDRVRPSVKTYRGGLVSRRVDRSVSDALRKLCRQEGGTLFMGLLSAVKVLLYRYTGQSDIVVGSPIAGRDHSDLEGQIGFYVNTLALRTRFGSEDSFRSLLGKVKSVTLGGYEHQVYPFDELVDDLNLQRDISRNALFDVMVVSQDVGLEEENLSPEDLGLLRVGRYGSGNHIVSKFDLTFNFSERADGIDANVEFNSDLFDVTTAERMVGHLGQLLRALVASPDQAVNQIDYLSEREYEQLLKDFNHTAADDGLENTIIGVFEDQVERTPDSSALVYEGANLTYKELNARANQLANYLQANYDLRQEDRVGIQLERSDWLLVSILGVLKCGLAYVPLDPSYPTERIAYMLSDSQCKVVLDGDFLDRFQLLRGSYGVENLGAQIDRESLAYVIYTSGSTGLPKGVMIEHRSIFNTIQAQINIFKARQGERHLQFASSAFDAFISEVFVSFASGAELYIIGDAEKSNPVLLQEFIAHNQIDLATIPPAYLRLLDVDQIKVLKRLVTAGETADVGRSNDFLRHGGILYNAYGPTESSICASVFESSPAGLAGHSSIPIGKPIGNAQIYILSDCDLLQGIGIPGEICIGGAGVARGYLNRAELTASKFVENPFVTGGRMYRSGDVGRWLPDGNIEFLGRKDDQVKIRGYRIEVGEIETILQKHPQVDSAVVTVYTASTGEKELVGYVGAKEPVNSAALRHYLGEYLPGYMVPGSFVQLSSLPLTANGKVDRKKLPSPDGQELSSGAAYVGARNAVESKLVSIWEQVLNRPGVSVLDHFFQAGGHSLKAIQLVSQIHKVFDVRLAMRDVFNHPVLEAQVRLISGSGRNAFVSIEKVADQASYGLSSSQRRLWVLSQFEEGNTAYNMPGAFVLEGVLDRGAFDRAFESLIERHEVLRAVFREDVTGEVRQFILEVSSIGGRVEYDDVRSLGEGNRDAFVRESVQSEIEHVFDLSSGPLLRARLFQVAADKWVLSYVMHHIISDGWSMEILIRELLSLYNSYSRGESLNLAPLRIQYKDYAAWQQDQLSGDRLQVHRQYWLDQFDGELPVLDLPTDRIRPSVKTYRGGLVSRMLSNSLNQCLRRLCHQEGVTLFMGLLSAVDVLLYRYTGQSDIIVGSPIAGRDHADLEDQIGFYVNTLAFRTCFDGDDSYRSLLGKVKSVTLGGYEHQVYPFDELVDDLNLQRDMSRSALFDVMVVLQNTAVGTGGLTPAGLGSLRVEPYGESDHGISKFDLTFNFSERPDGIDASVEYNSDLFDAVTAERMVSHLEQLLGALVASPDQALNQIDYLSEGERKQLLKDFNDTAVDHGSGNTIIGLFEAQVERVPDSIAVVYEQTSLTYRELNARANRLANYLHKCGVQKGSLIPLLLQRSAEVIVGILGIMKVGAAYVPIDVNYPRNRIKGILKQLGDITHIITDSDSTKAIPDQPNVNIIVLGSELADSELSNYTSNDLPAADDLAYVIYTSGSTGQPKGVMIMHSALYNVSISWRDHYGLAFACPNVLSLASVSFDVFTGDICRSILHGGKLIIVPEEYRLDLQYLCEAIESYAVTILESTPSLIMSLMRYIEEQRVAISTLKVIIVGSDVLGYNDYKFLKEHFGKGRRIINSYGTTEATIDSSYFEGELSVLANVPIGKPLYNTSFYILDSKGQSVPIGVKGELWIGGAGLAKAYLNNDGLTSERFQFVSINDSPVRLYRTGDIARWRIDGNVELFGRKDDQVKIRGFRVDLTEIESAILSFDGIYAAAAVVKINGVGENELIVYIVSRSEIRVPMLRAHLSQMLPSHMIPGMFVSISNLPLSANGKVDKKRLDNINGTLLEGGIEYEGARNDVEAKVIEVWSKLLGTTKIGINDNFFDLGGNSLKIVTLSRELNRIFERKISVVSLFQYPTIKSLVDSINMSSSAEISVDFDRDGLIGDLDKFHV